MNRRQFLTTSTAAAAAMALSACRGASRKGTTSSATTRPLGANSDIRVAVIGFNSHGRSHIKAYRSMPGVRLVALCDVDERVLQTHADALAKDGINVKTYRDIRKLLDSNQVDAISCAMPNRWHCLAAVWACQAGKDACVEKPVSHCIWEGRQAVKAARKYRCMVQTDLDSRSRPALDEAYAYVQSGQIGRIVYAHAWDYKRRDTMGKVTGPQRIPDHIDYDLWTGPAPLLPLTRTKFHYDWHWQWAHGSGEIANNGSHVLDQVRWAIAKPGLPTSVMSFGGRFGYADDGQTPNTLVAVYDYDGIPVLYECRGLPEKSGARNMSNLETRTGDGRPLVIPHDGNNQGLAIFCEGGYCLEGVIYDNAGRQMTRFDSTSNPLGRSQLRFINAVRSRRTGDLKTDIEQGHLSAAFCHMGNVSFACGEAMTFEKATQSIGETPYAKSALERMKAHLSANGVDLATTPITVGPTLTMDSRTERFTGPGSERASLFLKDSYRAQFVVPDTV